MLTSIEKGTPHPGTSPNPSVPICYIFSILSFFYKTSDLRLFSEDLRNSYGIMAALDCSQIGRASCRERV